VAPVQPDESSGRDDRRIYLSPPDVRHRERERLLAAVDGNWIAPVGPDVDAFEAELVRISGMPHAVAMSSGTAALHLALEEVGVAAGDDVLVSSFTFVATANAVAYLGARPVFIDSELESWNISPALLTEELEERARSGRLPAAVVVVDLYGQCADYDPIIEVCRRFDIPLVEDAAEAVGADYRGRPAGSLGDIGVFSFNGNKLITTGGGGAIVTREQSIRDRVHYLATQARQSAPHYEHTEIGYNYRLSNLLAAFGLGQLDTLEARIARTRAIRQRYVTELVSAPGLHIAPIPEWGTTNAWLTCLTLDPVHARVDREELRQHLEAQNVEARPLWKPLHLQPVFAGADKRVDGTSEGLFDIGLCLPSGSGMSDEEQGRVIVGVLSVAG
jgi:dTDP-4-amino-4,6-dideoxygalactose transaminase